MVPGGVESARAWCGRRGLTFVRYEMRGRGRGAKERSMQKGRRQDQWPQSWSPSNTTWGKGREWQVKKSLTWTGMAVGERVIGSFRSRPHRHGVFGGSGPRGRSESGTCSARLPGWVGEVCRTALASTPNVTIQEAQCRGEGSRHGTGPQPAVDMTAQIHGVGSGKDGQEQQLQLGSCCVAGGPAPGVSAVSAARGLAERAAAAAADTVPRGPRGPLDPASSDAEPGFGILPPSNMGQLADQCGQGFQINGTAPLAPVHWCRHV